MEDSRDDEALIAAANAGDASAMEALYVRHRDWVYGMALRACHCREDALDVMQQVFMEFFGRFPGLDLRCGVRTYLYPMVRRRTVDLLRKRGRREVQVPEALPEVEVAGEQGRDRLRDLVAALGPEQREVVLLRFGEGLRLAEIAARLDVPEGTVKSRLHYALEALRLELG